MYLAKQLTTLILHARSASASATAITATVMHGRAKIRAE